MSNIHFVTAHKIGWRKNEILCTNYLLKILQIARNWNNYNVKCYYFLPKLYLIAVGWFSEKISNISELWWKCQSLGRNVYFLPVMWVEIRIFIWNLIFISFKINATPKRYRNIARKVFWLINNHQQNNNKICRVLTCILPKGCCCLMSCIFWTSIKFA